ncbi:MAG TPA: hypothetical protein VGP73_09375 [Thermoanaerobaculia bacterium]
MPIRVALPGLRYHSAVLEDPTLAAARSLAGFRGGSSLSTWLYSIKPPLDRVPDEELAPTLGFVHDLRDEAGAGEREDGIPFLE